jgi:hypothetical protein
VKGPQEATLDSAFLLMASNMGAQKARAMKSGSGSFDIDDLVSRLVAFMGGAKQLNVDDDFEGEDAEVDGAPLEWDRIGRKAMAKSRRVPAMGFMRVACLSRRVRPGLILSIPGLARSRSNKRSELSLNAPSLKRIKRRRGNRKSSRKKTSRGQRTRPPRTLRP